MGRDRLMATRTGSRRTRVRRGGTRVANATLGPFQGVIDCEDPRGADWSKYLNFAINKWIPPNDTGMETRPGFGTEVITAGAQCRGIYLFAKSDGTRFPVAILGTHVWRIDTGVDVTPTVTTIAAGSGTVFAVMYNDEMIFNDGVNPPFRWNGVGGSAGTVIAFNVGTGVAYGAPWVYLAKLFFIRADARLQFVWSEENQAGVGYQQTNYANFWNFQQSSSEPLCAGIGTNDGMYIFRAKSIAYVTGAVSANFSTTGTFDGVSDHIGCPCPSAIVRVAQTVYFLDMFGRLHAAGPDPNVRALYNPALVETQQWAYALGDGTAAATALPPCQLVYWKEADILLHQIPVQNPGDTPPYCLCWQRSTERYFGRWQDGATAGYLYGTLSTVANQGIRTLGLGPLAGATVGDVLFRQDTAGNIDYAVLSSGLGNNGLFDNPAGVKSAIVTVEMTGPVLYDDTVTKIFERIAWIGECGAPFAGTGFSLQTRWLTNLGNGSAFTKLPTVPANPGTQARADVRFEVARILYGPAAATGRYLRVKFVGGYDAQNGNIQGWGKTLGVFVEASVEVMTYTQDTPTVSSYGSF